MQILHSICTLLARSTTGVFTTAGKNSHPISLFIFRQHRSLILNRKSSTYVTVIIVYSIPYTLHLQMNKSKSLRWYLRVQLRNHIFRKYNMYTKLQIFCFYYYLPWCAGLWVRRLLRVMFSCFEVGLNFLSLISVTQSARE